MTLKVGELSLEARVEDIHPLRPPREASFFPHSHTAYEVYFLKKGNMTVFCDKKELLLQEGEVFMILTHTEHFVHSCSADLQKFNLRFLLPDGERLPTGRDSFRVALSPKKRREIFRCIDGIQENMDSKESDAALFRIRSYLGIVFCNLTEPILSREDLLRESAALQSPSHENRLQQFIRMDQFFLERYGDAVTLEDLADELHYSKTHVNRLLRQYWRVSFSQKLDEIRLRAARGMLREGDLSVGEIAEKCGFSTLRGFELFFRRMTGELPAKYRAKGAEENKKKRKTR